MSTVKRNTPLMRFRGFDAPWRTIALNEIAELVRDTNTVDSQNVLTISAQQGLVSQTEFFNKIVAGKNLSRYLLVQPGDFVYNRSYSKEYALGAIKDWTPETPDQKYGIVSPMYVVFRANKDVREFLSLIWDTDVWHSSLSQRIVMGVRHHGMLNIRPSEFMKMTVLLPEDPDERAKVVKLVKLLRKLVELEEKKHDILQRGGFEGFQMICVQPGDTNPRLRFKGFTEPWVRRSLDELAPVRDGYIFRSQDFSNEGVPVVRISNILPSGLVGGEFTHHPEMLNDDRFSLPDGALLIALSGATVGKLAVLRKDSNEKVYQNQRVGYFRHTDNIDYDFLCMWVQSHIFSQRLRQLGGNSVRLNISTKEINGMYVSIPSDRKEQQRVAELGEKFNRLLQLQDERVDAIKKLYNAFLKALFV